MNDPKKVTMTPIVYNPDKPETVLFDGYKMACDELSLKIIKFEETVKERTSPVIGEYAHAILSDVQRLITRMKNSIEDRSYVQHLGELNLAESVSDESN